MFWDDDESNTKNKFAIYETSLALDQDMQAYF